MNAWGILIATCVSGLGLLSIIPTGRHLLRTLRLGLLGRWTRGIISNNPYGATESRASFDYEGRSYRTRKAAVSGSGAPRLGDRVTVFFNPARPADAMIVSAGELAFIYVFFLLGLIMLLGPRVLWIHLRFDLRVVCGELAAKWPIIRRAGAAGEDFVGTIISSFIGSMGLVFVSGLWRQLRHRWRLRREGIRAIGTVVEQLPAWDGEATTPVVAVEFEGKPLILSGEIAGPGHPSLGQAVKVAIDPRHPKRSIILNWVEVIPPTNMFVFALVLAIGGLGASVVFAARFLMTILFG